MKTYLKVAVVLGAVCAVSAFLLAFADKITAPAIAGYENSVVHKALEEVSCGYEIGDSVKSDDKYVSEYHTLTQSGTVKGYILNLVTNGYGGEMILAASFADDGSVMSVKMVSNNETPGVGKKSEKDGYMDKFIGKGSNEPVPTSKSMLPDSESALISGATMTFNGISKALSAGSEFVRKLGGAK